MKPLNRVPTGIPGFDDVLGGGLMEAGVYFVQGRPGTGKTTLAAQVCFNHIRRGGNALFITMLAESHSRMLQHMMGQSFFDQSMVGSRVGFISAYQQLESGGLKAIVALARTELVRSRASMLVLDGLVPVTRATADDNRRLKEFVHEMQSLAQLVGSNVLLLTSGGNDGFAAEQTMVDGIFHLEDRACGARAERLLQVSKFRGGKVLRGSHSYCITDDGLRVFPRIESRDAVEPPAQPAFDSHVSTGLPGLDRLLLGGGLVAGGTTLLVGPAGSGKTLLGLRFLAQCDSGAPGCHMGFHEAPQALLEMARGVGGDLAPQIGGGALAFDWVQPGDHSLDELGERLLDAVARRRARRVVLDSLAGLASATLFHERGFRFVWALLDELRRRGVNTLLTCDPAGMAALGAGAAVQGVAALVEHVIELAVTPTGARQLAVTKCRAQGFDARPHPLRIDGSGLAIDRPQPAAGA